MNIEEQKSKRFYKDEFGRWFKRYETGAVMVKDEWLIDTLDIREERQGAVEKLFKTLLCIEGVNSDDFSEDMDMKATSKTKFTQADARELQAKMVTTYHLAHNIVADCCRNTHDKMLEDIYKGLIDSNFIGNDTLKESFSSYLKSLEDKDKEGK